MMARMIQVALLCELDDSSRTFFEEKIKPLIGDFFEVNATIEKLGKTFPANFNKLPNKSGGEGKAT